MQDPERGFKSEVVTSGPLSEDATHDVLRAVTEASSEAKTVWANKYTYTDVEELMEAFIAEKLVVVDNKRSVLNQRWVYWSFENWYEGRVDGQTASNLHSALPGSSISKGQFTSFLDKSFGNQIGWQSGGPGGGVCFCGLDYKSER